MKSLLIGLPIMFCLLLSNIANAQCGWVLWHHIKSQKVAKGDWSIIEVFPSYDLCIKERDKSVSATAANVKNITQVGKGEFLVNYKGGSSGIMESKCLPDTVDPRK